MEYVNDLLNPGVSTAAKVCTAADLAYSEAVDILGLELVDSIIAKNLTSNNINILCSLLQRGLKKGTYVQLENRHLTPALNISLPVALAIGGPDFNYLSQFPIAPKITPKKDPVGMDAFKQLNAALLSGASLTDVVKKLCFTTDNNANFLAYLKEVRGEDNNNEYAALFSAYGMYNNIVLRSLKYIHLLENVTKKYKLLSSTEEHAFRGSLPNASYDAEKSELVICVYKKNDHDVYSDILTEGKGLIIKATVRSNTDWYTISGISKELKVYYAAERHNGELLFSTESLNEKYRVKSYTEVCLYRVIYSFLKTAFKVNMYNYLQSDTKDAKSLERCLSLVRDIYYKVTCYWFNGKKVEVKSQAEEDNDLTDLKVEADKFAADSSDGDSDSDVDLTEAVKEKPAKKVEIDEYGVTLPQKRGAYSEVIVKNGIVSFLLLENNSYVDNPTTQSQEQYLQEREKVIMERTAEIKKQTKKSKRT